MVYLNNLLGMTVKVLEGLTGRSKLTALYPLFLWRKKFMNITQLPTKGH